jgi:hypothetical protein
MTKVLTMNRQQKWLQSACLVVLVGLGACGAPVGSIDVRAWGEEFVANEIPASEFEDGWRVQFSKFLVHVSGVRFAATGGPSYTLTGGGRVFDLKPAAQPLSIGTISMVEARRLDDVRFELSAATASSTVGNASASDLMVMQGGRYALYVEGTASHPMRGTRSFRWGFAGNTRFSNCRDAASQPGIVVTSGTAATPAQLTFHADHLFYDGLQNPEAKLRFDAIASADRNMDMMVTLDELATVDLTTLPTGQYTTGSARNVNTLRDFVTALVTNVGHWNGEGHCDEAAF